MSIKKILSLVLIFSILMTTFAVGTFAAEEELSGAQLTPDVPYYRAVTVLSALGIMEGKSETDFGENDFLTRAEMSTIAVRLIGLDLEGAAGAESGYSDVDSSHWGKYYIDTATALDIVSGNGDGTFSPDDETTAEHAVKMLVCALGYELMAEDRGGYPAGYRAVAAQLDLLSGVDFPEGLDTPIERWKIAMLVYNALEVDLMEVKAYGDGQYSAVTQDKTALGAYHDVERRTGTVTATYESTIDQEDMAPGEVMVDGVKYRTELNLSKYIGYKVDIYCRIVNGREIHEIIAVFPVEGEADRTEVDFDDINSVTVSANLDVTVDYSTEDGKSKRLSASGPVIMYNGKAEEFADAAAAQAFLDANMNQGQLVLLKNSGNGSRDVLFVENYDAYVVTAAESKNMQISYNIYEVGKINTATLDLSADDNPERKVFIYNENGEEITIDDLVKDDVIMVYASTDKLLYRIYQSKKQVTGVIDRRDEIPGTEPEPVEPLPTYWETLSTVSLADYTQIVPAENEKYAVTSEVRASGTIDNRTSYLSVQSGEYDGKAGRYPTLVSDTGKKRLYFLTSFADVPNVDYGWPADFPGTAGSKVFELSRAETSSWTMWNKWSPYYEGLKPYRWMGAGWGAPDSYIMLTNLFDESKVMTGDKLRITAWVMGRNIYDVPETAGDPYGVPTESAETTAPVQMWISENTSTDGDWQWGEDMDYNKADPDPNKPDEAVTDTLTDSEWKKLVLEYEITPENAGISSIQINNDNAAHDVTHFPLQLALAGVTVERFVDPNVTTGRPELVVDSTDYDIYVDGKEYKPVSNFPTSLLEMGSSVTLLLDSNDKIVGYIRSLASTNYGLLMDVGVSYGAFGNNLQLKILGTDNKITVYETTEEVKAYNGTDVVKMPAEQLVTYDAADPKDDWHLWSYDNAEKFEAIPRTWLSDEDKSKAASRKVIYYETNAEGLVHTILVPSMPESHKDAKIVMVKDFEYGTDTLFHSSWPKWLTHASVVGRVETEYRLNDDLKKWFILPGEYAEHDYWYAGDGQENMWSGNSISGRAWNQAQLYRIPGAKTIDFMVINGSRLATSNDYQHDVIIVENIEETVDGYILNGYKPNQSAASASNHTYTAKIRKDLLVFENIWMSAPDASGTRITWDNIGEFANTLPYQCSYEALGQETPYVTTDTVEAGDIVLVRKQGDWLEYFEVIRRKSVGLCSAYTTTGRGDLANFFYNQDTYMNGEVTEINIKDGYVKVRGFYWPSANELVSTELYSQANNNSVNYITELETIFRPTPTMVIFDEKTNSYISAVFEDIDVGDIIFTKGVLSYPSVGVIFKNHNQ